MRLSKITIKNFRGIAHAEIELHRDITVLIGENNVGKTSILEALRFCLDTVKSDKSCNFTKSDFYREKTATTSSDYPTISLTLEFRESAKFRWSEEIMQNFSDVIVGADYSVIKLRVTANYDAITDELVQNFAFLDDSNNERHDKKGDINTLHRLRPFFFQRALRSVREEFRNSSTYWKSFLSKKDINKETQRILEDELSKISQKIVTEHNSFRQVADEMKRLSSLVAVGKNNAVSVDPVAPDIYKTLRYGTEVNLLTATDAKIPLHSHGEGTQSLAVLLLFSAYLKTRLTEETDKNAIPIIAIEEPEAHLHPSAERAVWQVLNDFPGQKIVATHSGNILSKVPLESVRRISRNVAGTQVSMLSNNETFSPEEERKLSYHIRAKRSNLLFAKSWLLIEGETEFWFLPEAAQYLDYDFDKEGVCCIEFAQCGLEPLIKLAKAFRIEWHVLTDNDQAGQKYIETAKKFLDGELESKHITALSEKDIEHELWKHGYSFVYENIMNCKTQRQTKKSSLKDNTKKKVIEYIVSLMPNLNQGAIRNVNIEITQPNPEKGTPEYVAQTIKQAIIATSKPHLAMAVIDAVKQENSKGLPEKIKSAIEQTVRNAKK